MDLQLNISSASKKPKKGAPQKKNISTDHEKQFSFVSKPVFEGKTIARTRKIPTNTENKNSSFSLLKTHTNESNIKENDSKIQSSTFIGKNKPKNKEKSNEFSEKRSPNKNESLTHKSEVKDFNHKQKNKIFESSSKLEDKTVDFPDVEPHEFSKKAFKNRTPKNERQSFKKKNTEKADERPVKKEIPIHAKVASLFKNNPEIPRIGQRHVKPITENVFSGKQFSDLNIHSYSIANLEKNLGLTELTVVQQKATPVILKGRDVLVRSQTGSGKTLAYALPIVEALGAIRPKLKRQDGVKALVIVPTRELALQTYELFIKLMRPYAWIVPGYLIGGENRKAEKARIRKGFNILVGTPGRICDHLQHTVSLKFNDTRCLILDEADRLLDMGYEKDVASIVQALDSHKAASGYNPMALMKQVISKAHIHFENDGEGDQNVLEEKQPEKQQNDEDREMAVKETKDGVVYQHELSNVFLSDRRQTVLLSATLTKAVETLAGLTMHDPVFIDSSDGRATLIADSIVKKEAIKVDEIADETAQQDSAEDFEIVPKEESDNEDDKLDRSDVKSEASDESSEADDEESEQDDDENVDGDDSNDGDENSDDDNDSDDSESGSDDGSEDDVKREPNVKEVMHKGLKAFGGLKLLKQDDDSPKKSPKNEDKIEKKKTKKAKESLAVNETGKNDKKEVKHVETKIKIEESSDSDSDYDIFKATKNDIKKVITKREVVEEEEKPDTKYVTESGDCNNPFQNALQNAIAQDEMIIPSSVTQVYIITPMKLRLVTLSALIVERCVNPGQGKMLIFMATQDLIDYHCEILSRVLTGKPPRKIEVVQPKKRIKKDKRRKLDESYGEIETENNEEIDDVEGNDEKKIDDDAESVSIDVKEKNKKGKKDKKSKKRDDDKEKSFDEDLKGNDDEYEFDYDGMSLKKYEAKMSTAKAFVDVEFLQLHGSMDQRTRTEVFKSFRKATSGVLLCTDVAARGLDLPHVDCIVQYTGPISATDYVHRVGRTARAGNVGTAIMLLLPSEVLFVRQLEERRIRLHQEDMECAMKSLLPPGSAGRGGTRGEPLPQRAAAAELQAAFEKLPMEDKQLYMKGCKAFTSWMRFYSTYPREARAAFDRSALHAGHAARALALQDPPRKLAAQAPRTEKERPDNRLTQDRQKRKDLRKEDIGGSVKRKLPPSLGARTPSAKAARRELHMVVSEFESGLQPPLKKSKTSKTSGLAVRR